MRRRKQTIKIITMKMKGERKERDRYWGNTAWIWRVQELRSHQNRRRKLKFIFLLFLRVILAQSTGSEVREAWGPILTRLPLVCDLEQITQLLRERVCRWTLNNQLWRERWNVICSLCQFPQVQRLPLWPISGYQPVVRQITKFLTI